MWVPSLEVTEFMLIPSGFPNRCCCVARRGDYLPATLSGVALLCGPPLASAVGGLVGQVDDARRQGLGLHELQRRTLLAVLEELLAATHDDGVNHEVQLVEQAVVEQRADKPAAAGDRDVLARLLLELGDLLLDVLAQQSR